MGEFIKDRLPEPESYFSGQGLNITGCGLWRDASPCNFHGGGKLRVNMKSGGWVCMSCGVKGGDVLNYHMQAHGLDFIEAAKALDAWRDNGKPNPTYKPLPFSARNALEVLRFESLLVAMAACSLAKGVPLSDKDRERLVQAAGRVEFIARGVA